ncbi:MAG: hypothetical protein C5B44_04590 [Acidobacteria bacterium]|nr:MAG: hypothetical protein C5B44_04590 [Acidobacteriota bacterium]
MRIDTDIQPKQIEPAIHWISGLIGGPLDRRIEGFKQHERRNPLLLSLFEIDYALEFAISECRQYLRKTGRLPKAGKFDAAYSFVVTAQRVHSALGQKEQSAFEGRIRNTISGQFGARPLAYELSIAVHLMQRGWDVEFVDLEGRENFDFLARRDNVAVDVECKTTSGDTGRKVHRRDVHRLADLLQEALVQLSEKKGCHLIRLTVPNRLGSQDADLRALASLVRAAVENRTEAKSKQAHVRYSRLVDIESWPDPRSHSLDARNFFEQQFGVANKHILFHVHQGYSIVAVLIESSEADRVIAAFTREAKHAAGQCSGQRPALVCLHMIDPLDRERLQSLLNTPNGLHEIAGTIFRDCRRQHVDSVVFTLPLEQGETNAGIRRMSAPAIVLNNPSAKFLCPDVRELFRVSR